MISTATMVRLGLVHENLMVNVSMSNEKLIERGRRILTTITGLGPDQADHYLRASGGMLRVAVVMAGLRVGRPEAEQRLERAGGSVRRALEGK
jgi:N-acetylmuramic acid 6-phosphate etherase